PLHGRRVRGRLVHDGLPGRGNPDQRRGRQGRGRRQVRRLQALHDRVSLRDSVLRPGHRQGLQVQPLRGAPGLRGGLPDGGDHVRRGGEQGLDRRFRRRADVARARPRGGVMAARHLIIGGGTAGLNAIRTIREEDGGASEITLVSAERPYSRMVLPYYLGASIAESHVYTATPASLAAWKVKPMLGRRAKSLDTQARTLTLDDGATVEYDNCVIATGSRAARPPIDGAEGPGVHSFWTLDEARAVIAAVQPGTKVVMVGAGFISFTILNAILARGASLTIVEVAPRILPRMVDEACAKIVARWLENHGVTLRVGASLSKIEEGKGKRKLSFKKGDPIFADVVIMATGIRTNLEWLEGSGIEVSSEPGGGILVDDH